MINYAHRGASEYAPENTFSSFYLGLMQGANGIETDVQKTVDGVPVLFHDPRVDNKTDGEGRVDEHTLAQLKKLRVYGKTTMNFYDRIPTLREFLERFSHYDIHFAIEMKGKNVEKETLELVKEFDIMEKVTFTSFHFEYVETLKKMEPKARIGWLTEDVDEESIARLKSIGGEEICPKAEAVTEEKMTLCRNAGLGVRAWGVTGVTLMKKMCHFGVDGMTVNFPDRLSQYLAFAQTK